MKQPGVEFIRLKLTTVTTTAGETNGFADALSRIYSDEQEGVVRADSEYVNDVDEPIRGRRQNTHPIYVDMALISIMNAETRRLSSFL